VTSPPGASNDGSADHAVMPRSAGAGSAGAGSSAAGPGASSSIVQLPRANRGGGAGCARTSSSNEVAPSGTFSKSTRNALVFSAQRRGSTRMIRSPRALRWIDAKL
jgi:hypothetical protein